MTRRFSAILLCTLLAALFAGLGVLLYTTQATIRDNDRERTEKRVRDSLERMGSDLDRVVQNAYFNFQLDPDLLRDPTVQALASRYEIWRQRSDYPDLIQGFVYVERRPGGVIVGSKVGDGRLVRDDGFASAAGIDPSRKEKISFGDQRVVLRLPIYSPIRSALPIPVGAEKRESMPRIPAPDQAGDLFVVLDRNVMVNRVLPDLAAKNFGDDPFVVSAEMGEGNVIWGTRLSSADAERGILTLVPDNLMFFTNKDMIASDSGSSSTVVLNSKVETRTFERSGRVSEGPVPNGSQMTIQVQKSEGNGARVFASRVSDEPAPARLIASHRLGSIEYAVDAAMRRSLTIAYSMLALVGIALFAILYSAYKARSLARRQLEFISSVSHEFRTPLAVIYSAAENIADGIPLERAGLTKYGEIIKAEGRKLSSMVEEILEFAGARSGGLKLRREPTDVAWLVDAGVDDARSVLDEKAAELEIEIQPGLRPVTVDRSAMIRAIQNLVANAAKYGGDRPSIRIVVDQGSSSTTIEVHDRGIGIAGSDLRRIFEPFYRSRSVVDAQIRGNGLGLSVVKQIAEAHNGSVRVESEPGKGSRFVLEIPNDEA